MAPQTPAAGAGIATLNPIPEVPRGDVDLIAPLGTIDPGEAGVRSSGNVNVAALHVVNAANIQAQGNSSGVPVTAAVNTSALSSASAASGAAAASAESEASRSRNAARQSQPSIISVQILGFGNEGAEGATQAPAGGSAGAPRRAPRADAAHYAPDAPVQVLGQVDLGQAELGRLTETEQRNLARLTAEGAEPARLEWQTGRPLRAALFVLASALNSASVALMGRRPQPSASQAFGQGACLACFPKPMPWKLRQDCSQINFRIAGIRLLPDPRSRVVSGLRAIEGV